MPEGPPSDDRFSDLGEDEAGRRRRKAIGDALEERDRVAPEPDDRRPEVPRPGNKYAWVVGIVMLMGIGVLLLTTALPNTGEGVRGPRPGDSLPLFAAPLATADVDDEANANVCQREPCPKEAGKAPACELRTEVVLNVCELRRDPLVLTFMVTAGTDCEPQIDRVERVRGEFPGIQFAVVMSGNNRSEAQKIVERRGWQQPVGVDNDGAVVNLYGIGICPVTVFALPGGRVLETALGNLTEDELKRKARRLARIHGPRPGETLPAFAAPLAPAGDVDANTCQEEPCALAEGAVPACEARGEVLNLCVLRRRPFILTFAGVGTTDCASQIDRVERVSSELPELNYAAVLPAGAKRAAWKQPVAVDSDGAVANLYGVGVCPVTIFARRGGRVLETAVGELSEAQLRRKARRLVSRGG